MESPSFFMNFSGNLERINEFKNHYLRMTWICCDSARILTSLRKTEKRFFFCGIWDDWASNSDMTVILQIFGLWTLKKIQKKFFSFFMNFSWRYGTRMAKNPVFLTKNGEMGFFSEVHPIFWSFFRWCTLEGQKWSKTYEKQIFVKFCPSYGASLL